MTDGTDGLEEPVIIENGLPEYNAGHLPTDPEEWPVYRKTALTRALRVQGPFVVETSEGRLRCQDGYLAMDARGYPYPIATEEFEQIYERVETGG